MAEATGNQAFIDAATAAKSLSYQPSNAELLILYGLFKQGTIGDNESARPGMFDLQGKAKWDAWSQNKGMSKEDAQAKYIEYVKSLQAKKEGMYRRVGVPRENYDEKRRILINQKAFREGWDPFLKRIKDAIIIKHPQKNHPGAGINSTFGVLNKTAKVLDFLYYNAGKKHKPPDFTFIEDTHDYGMFEYLEQCDEPIVGSPMEAVADAIRRAIESFTRDPKVDEKWDRVFPKRDCEYISKHEHNEDIRRLQEFLHAKQFEWNQRGFVIASNLDDRDIPMEEGMIGLVNAEMKYIMAQSPPNPKANKDRMLEKIAVANIEARFQKIYSESFTPSRLYQKILLRIAHLAPYTRMKDFSSDYVETAANTFRWLMHSYLLLDKRAMYISKEFSFDELKSLAVEIGLPGFHCSDKEVCEMLPELKAAARKLAAESGVSVETLEQYEQTHVENVAMCCENYETIRRFKKAFKNIEGDGVLFYQ